MEHAPLQVTITRLRSRTSKVSTVRLEYSFWLLHEFRSLSPFRLFSLVSQVVGVRQGLLIKSSENL